MTIEKIYLFAVLYVLYWVSMVVASFILYYDRGEYWPFKFAVPLLLGAGFYFTFLFMSGHAHQEGPFGISALLVLIVLGAISGARSDIEREDLRRAEQCRQARLICDEDEPVAGV